MHNSAKFPLAHVVQEKNAGSRLKKHLCVDTSVLFPRSAREKRMWMDWKNVCLHALTFMWRNQVHCWCCGRSKSNPFGFGIPKCPSLLHPQKNWSPKLSIFLTAI